MARLILNKVVSTLPSLEANTVYFVRTGNGFDLYVSDSTGSIAHTLNLPYKVPGAPYLRDSNIGVGVGGAGKIMFDNDTASLVRTINMNFTDVSGSNGPGIAVGNEIWIYSVGGKVATGFKVFGVSVNTSRALLTVAGGAGSLPSVSGICGVVVLPRNTHYATGDLKFAMRSTPEEGWIYATGTIGNASSGASNRANSDCYELFVLLWTDFSNSQAPVSSGRGASAAADWAANKTIGVPDCRGRILCAQDNMGGSAAGIVTSAGSGINATVLGTTGGLEQVTLTAAQSGSPAHSHPLSDRYNGSRSAQGGTNITVGSSAVLTAADNTGLSTAQNAASAHTNMPPVIVVPCFIKL